MINGKVQLTQAYTKKWMYDLNQTGKILITIWPSTSIHVGTPLTKSHQESSYAKVSSIMFTIVVYSCVINYTGGYNLLHNSHGNKSYIVKTKKAIEERKFFSTCILLLILMSQTVPHTIKVEVSSSIIFTSHFQQSNLQNLQTNKVYVQWGLRWW